VSWPSARGCRCSTRCSSGSDRRVREHGVLVALGIRADGTKHALGLWEGSTENATVRQRLTREFARPGTPHRSQSARDPRCLESLAEVRGVAAGVLEAVKGFRRLQGHADMSKLVAARRARDQQLGLGEAVEHVALNVT